MLNYKEGKYVKKTLSTYGRVLGSMNITHIIKQKSDEKGRDGKQASRCK
jgi:hypothetical protein